MQKFICFINEVGTKHFVAVSSFQETHVEVINLLTDVFIGGEKVKVYICGDFIYKPIYVNQPIRVGDKFYKVVSLKQVGYIYVIDTKDDGSEKWECLSSSRSFATHEDCYNAMKKEAMIDLGTDIDIEQDFNFSSDDTYKREVIFKKSCITWHGDGKTMKYQVKCIK